jgi:hypothetical protein
MKDGGKMSNKKRQQKKFDELCKALTKMTPEQRKKIEDAFVEREQILLNDPLQHSSVPNFVRRIGKRLDKIGDN